MPARGGEALSRGGDTVQKLGDAFEHDERRRARERASDVRVCVDVSGPKVPRRRVLGADERSRERKSSSERLPGCDDVGDVAASPDDAGATEAAVDLVGDEKRPCLVAALAQALEEPVRRHAHAAAPLDRLDDRAPRIGRERPGVVAVREPVHRPRKPGGERVAEAREPGRGEREKARPVVRALERDDSGPSRHEEGRAKRDLHRVLARDAEDRCATGERRAQSCAQLGGDIGLGEVAERVHAASRLTRDRRAHLGIAVAEGGHPESAGEVEERAAVRVDHAAAARLYPCVQEPRTERPSRRGSTRFSASNAM